MSYDLGVQAVGVLYVLAPSSLGMRQAGQGPPVSYDLGVQAVGWGESNQLVYGEEQVVVKAFLNFVGVSVRVSSQPIETF